MVEEAKESTAEEYKDIGNECMKNGKYMEAVLNYTFAIKQHLRTAEIYSNRSFAFLKASQLYYALEDSEQAINMRPKWSKGYYRKGEVLFVAEQYKEAREMYQKALQLQPDDSSLLNCIEKTKTAQRAAEQRDMQIPWLGTAIGLVIGIIGIVFEYFAVGNQNLHHPFLQVFIIILVALLGYGISCLYRKQLKSYKLTMLEKPIDLFGFLAFMALYLVLGWAAELLCNIIGFAYPAYQSLKALESSSKDDDTKWLVYWVTFAFFSILEFFSEKLLDWFPPYFLMKVVFMIWLYAPFEHNGSYMLYNKVIRPIFIRNQFQIDQVLSKAVGAVSSAAGSAFSQAKKPSSKTE